MVVNVTRFGNRLLRVRKYELGLISFIGVTTLLFLEYFGRFLNFCLLIFCDFFLDPSPDGSLLRFHHKSLHRLL